MIAVTGIVAKQDLLTEISQRRVQQAKAINEQGLVEYARSLLVQIASLIESNMTTYDICTSQVRDQYKSKLWTTDFRDKLSLGFDLVMRYEPLVPIIGKAGKVGDDVYLEQLDSTYKRSDYKSHKNSKLLQALDYLEETGFVKLNHASLSTYTKNQKDQYIYVPYSVALTKQGKAYISSLKEQN